MGAPVPLTHVAIPPHTPFTTTVTMGTSAGGQIFFSASLTASFSATPTDQRQQWERFCYLAPGPFLFKDILQHKIKLADTS